MSKLSNVYTFKIATLGGTKVFLSQDYQTSCILVRTRGTDTPSHLNGHEFDVYKGGDKKVTIIRDDKVIDTGVVGYRGRHDGDAVFINFRQDYIDASNSLKGTPGFLLASAMENGDEIVISSPDYYAPNLQAV